MRHVCILTSGEYEPGDQPPDGYIQRQEWARVQMKAGLRQAKCPGCFKWLFPQQVKTHSCEPRQ